MSDLFKVKKSGEKPIPKEFLFVVWGVDGPAVVFASGLGVQNEIAGDAETFADCVRAGLTKNDPDHGIWVWEGIPFEEWSPDTPNGPSEYEGLNLSGGTWRSPTEEEMAAFLSGKRAWPDMLGLVVMPGICPVCDRPCSENSLGTIVDPADGARVHSNCFSKERKEPVKS